MKNAFNNQKVRTFKKLYIKGWLFLLFKDEHRARWWCLLVANYKCVLLHLFIDDWVVFWCSSTPQTEKVQCTHGTGAKGSQWVLGDKTTVLPQVRLWYPCVSISDVDRFTSFYSTYHSLWRVWWHWWCHLFISYHHLTNTKLPKKLALVDVSGGSYDTQRKTSTFLKEVRAPWSNNHMYNNQTISGVCLIVTRNEFPFPFHFLF